MAIDLANVAAGVGGFVIHGQEKFDEVGRSVASAGDINGDGFDDIIIGAEGGDGPGNTRAGAGDSYVVFGKASGFAAEIDLAAVAAGNGGFVIYGQDVGDQSGRSVSSAGDINGDGFADLIIGAELADGPGNTRNGAGDSYVVFGHAGGFAAAIDLAAVAGGDGGFVIHGQDVGDLSGESVSSAGDVNGDGFADVIIGASGASGPGNTRLSAGDSYVVFGKASGFAAEIDLATVAGGNGGFVIHGEEQGDDSGVSVSSAGDINGDGFDDLIIAALNSDGPGNTRPGAGDSYVVFGKASGFAAEIDLAAVAAGNGGFVIHGQDSGDHISSVSSAGDVNGDGFDDLLIGASDGDGPNNTRDRAGDSYVVFGHAGSFAAQIDLGALAAGSGFVIHGEDAGDHSGYSVSSAGDVNGDGFDDLLIGAYNADSAGNMRESAGDSYVVFGHAGGFGAEIDLASVAGGNGGFVIHGKDGFGTGHVVDMGDESGISVSSAGDINGDGFDDLIIGAWFGNGPGGNPIDTGDSYVLFGSATIGDSINHVTHPGTAGDDILVGNSIPNDMVGGLGNDVLVGNGGADVLRGGAGNDTLVIADSAFLRVAGGDGFDTLAFSGGIILGDAGFRQIDGIESIRLANGATTLILGAIASHAIDALRLTIDGAAVTNAFVNIDGSGLLRALSVNLANDAANVILMGGSGNDTLVGGKGDDFFDGGAGADAITGGGGNDTVSYASSALAVGVNLATGLGSGGDAVGDTLTGIENVFGSNQGDILTGNDGANTLSGLSGNDILDGGGGDDLVIGGPGNDAAFLGAGNDVFQWNHGDANDTVDGQDGVDRLDFNGAFFAENIDISANGARAHVTRDVDAVTMDLNDVENTTFNVLGGADVINVNDLSGTDVTDVIIRLAGTLGGNTGDNQVDQTIVNGSAGDDVVGILGQNGFLAVAGLSALVSISTSEATDALIVKGGAGNDNLSALTLPAGNTALTLDGGIGNDTLVGSLGADVLLGGDGNDTLTGGPGNDALFGGAGNDIYFVDGAGDGVIENANEGNDTVFSTDHLRLSANVETLVLQGNADLQGYGNSLNNLIQGNAGNNLLDGDAGADVMVGGAGNDAYFVDNAGDMVVENANQGNDVVFSTAHLRLAANVETLVLQGNADLQGYGNNLNNALYGNAGNNLLDGDAGADVMVGGAGNDVYFVDNAGDVVIENANEGNDAVFSTAHFQLSENVETLVLQGTADLQGYGNSQANDLHGNSGSNLLDGRGGADTMSGGLGNDVYFVDDPGDFVFENANEGNDAVFSTVNYTLTANVETLVLQGGGNLSGTGNALANSIFGNSGNNTLDGGGGADVLTGGAGNDTFVFHAGQANNDTVVDFIGNGAAAGDALQFVGFGTAAQGATFTQIGATNQWQIHSGLDGHNEIVTFSNAAVIHPSDFLFV